MKATTPQPANVSTQRNMYHLLQAVEMLKEVKYL
jgi:hypothetical protein